MSAQAPASVPASSAPRRGAFEAVLGVTGEILISAGVLIGLYVVWQLFYTDVQSERVHDRTLDAIEWEQQPTDVVRAVEAAGGDAPAVEVPEIIQTIPDSAKVFSPLGAPVIADPDHASTFGVMYVPRWGDDYAKPIAEGTSRTDVLDRLGIGHYEDTQLPGELGNFAVAAHRTTYGRPFSDIDTLQAGDPIVIQTENAWYVYRVTEHEIVAPSYIAAIAPVPGEPGVAPVAASITLTSCHPRYSAEQRYIVWGELEYWAPTGQGVPGELVEEA